MGRLVHCLYQITNLLNGNYYIGVHKGSMHRYWGSGNAIKRAIRKYGKQNFRRDILAEVETEKLVYLLESAVVNQVFVDRVDTYNICLGGRIPPNVKGIIRSPETRRKMSASGIGKHSFHNLGRIASPGTRKKLSLAKKGNTNNLGRHISVGAKRKQSLSMLGKNVGKVRSLETRKKMSEAKRGRALSDIHKQHLSQSAFGRPHPHKGTPHTEESKQRIRDGKKRGRELRISVAGVL